MQIVGEKKKIVVFSALLTSVWFIFIAWCLLTLAQSSRRYVPFYMVTAVLAEIILYFCFRDCNKIMSRNTCDQIDVLVFSATVVSVIVLPIFSIKILHTGRGYEMIVFASWILLCMLLLFKKHCGESMIARVLAIMQNAIIKVKSIKWLIILLLIAGILCIEKGVPLLKWDSYLYYTAAKDYSFDSLSSLAAYGHPSQTYGVVILCLYLILGNLPMSMTVANVSLMMLSICAFYGIMEVTVPKRKDSEYAIVTSIYAFSPFVLGMVHYPNLDYICLCMSVIMVYFAVSHKWVWQTVTALMFCFTKEPAIIIYGGFCIGYLIADLISLRKKGEKHIISTIVQRPQYWFMLSMAAFWLIIFRALGMWTEGNSQFGFDILHIKDNLKIVYVLNFNWILLIASIIVIVWSVIHKKEISEWMLPLILSHLFFVIFGCAFCTANNPRYIDTGAFLLYFLTAAGILEYLHGIKADIVSAGLAVILLVSCFLTIDPVIKKELVCFDIGESRMISGTESPLGDAMIYNRQMIYYDQALSKAMESHVEAGDTIVLSATHYNNSYYMDGMQSNDCSSEDEPVYYEEYYNGVRNFIGKGQKIKVYQVALPEQIEKLASEGKNVSVFWISGMIDNPGETLDKGKYDITEDATVYKNWKIMCTSYRIKN